MPSASGSASNEPAPVDPSCDKPWVVLRKTVVGDTRAMLQVKERLTELSWFSQCMGPEPVAPTDVCVYRVHFYGSKSFKHLEKNRDAIAARCSSKVRCEILAQHVTGSGGVRCVGTIPTSGAIEKMDW
jgi:hypothetical protein